MRSTATIVSDHFGMPAALQWKGVAELIAKGVNSLAHSAVVSMIAAAACAIAIEVMRIVTKGHAVWVEGYESICAGLISGSALVGIGNAIVNLLL